MRNFEHGLRIDAEKLRAPAPGTPATESSGPTGA